MNEWFEAEQRVERAQQLSDSLRWDEALAEIDAALAINPNNAFWHAQRGCILEELQRWDKAAAAYETALELEPGDRDVSVALGAALTRLGHYTRALELFEELAKLYPDFEPAYCQRIHIYGELGRHEQAEEMFYLAQELNDACPHCFFYMGASLLARGQTDRAIYCWQRVLELDPAAIGVNRRIGQAHRLRGQLDLAKDYYLREVRDDPGNTDLLFELAEVTLEAGEFAAAAAKFAQILELDPGHTRSRFALGTIWLRRGQPSQALACFEAIRSTGDGGADLSGLEFRTGEALFQLGRFAEARQRLETAAEQEPGEPVWMLLGDTLLALDKPERAADAFRRVLAKAGNNHLAHHKLALCLIRQGRVDAGLDHCLQAIRVKGDYQPAIYSAVLAYLKLAQWRNARSMLRRAIRNDPRNPEPRRLARRIWRFRLGHYGERLWVLARRALGRCPP